MGFSPLPPHAKKGPKLIRMKCLRWCRRNKEAIVAVGNNASIISVTLESWYSALVGLVGQQVNEGNGINTQGVGVPPRDRSRDAASLEAY